MTIYIALNKNLSVIVKVFIESLTKDEHIFLFLHWHKLLLALCLENILQ